MDRKINDYLDILELNNYEYLSVELINEKAHLKENNYLSENNDISKYAIKKIREAQSFLCMHIGYVNIYLKTKQEVKFNDISSDIISANDEYLLFIEEENRKLLEEKRKKEELEKKILEEEKRKKELELLQKKKDEMTASVSKLFSCYKKELYDENNKELLDNMYEFHLEQINKIKSFDEVYKADDAAKLDFDSVKTIKERKRNKIVKMITISFLSIASVVSLVMIILTFSYFVPSAKFNESMKVFNSGDYYKAMESFNSTYTWGDSRNMYFMSKAGYCFSNDDIEGGFSSMVDGNSKTIIHFENTNSIETEIADSKEYKLPILHESGKVIDYWDIKSFEFENSESGLVANLTLTAVWKDEPFTITYDLEGGSSTNPTSYTVETNDIVLTEPEKHGYTFLGWTNDELTTPTKEVTIPKGSYKNLSFKANWELTEYDITVDPYNGSEPIVLKYTINSNDISLEEPIRVGYEFIGWSTDVSDVPIKTMTIYKGSYGNKFFRANWKKVNYTISYDLEGGSSTNPTIYNIETSNITLTDPQKTGYTFMGWKNNENDTPIKNVTIQRGSYGDKYFKATWELTEYDIRINKNDGSELVVLKYTIESDDMNLGKPSRLGYDFIGWTIDESNTSVKDLTIPKGSYGNKYIFANWNTIDYVINYSLSGGITTNPASYTIESNDIVLTDAKRNGYAFLGWTGEGVIEPTKNITIPLGSHKNLLYVANWELIEYSLTVDLNDGSNPVVTKYTAESDDIKLEEPTRIGYEFIGWTIDSLDEPVKNLTIPKGSYGNKQIKANWQAVDYVINYVLDGGTNTNPVSYTIETSDIVLADPQKIGYTFLGWTGEGVTEPTKNITIPLGSHKNLLFIANWEINLYSISINNTNPSAAIISFVDGEYVYNQVVSIEYELMGNYVVWFENQYGETINTTFSVPAYDLEVTINYKYYEWVDDEKTSIKFGSYPQSLVEDSAITEKLDLMVGVLPEISIYKGISWLNYEESSQWTSYGYYSNGQVCHYMWYQDIKLEDDNYRAVFFRMIRNVSSQSEACYAKEGYNYTIDTIYYFKFEPIVWNVLEVDSSGNALIESSMVVDAQYFRAETNGRTISGQTIYNNNWEYSDMRKFLNETFFNQSFDNNHKTIILDTLNDNSNTGSSLDICNESQNSTIDKIYLLSYKDEDNYHKLSSERIVEGTDYAFCQGYKSNIYILRSSIYLIDTNDTGALWGIDSTNFSFYFGSNSVSGLKPTCRIKL